MRGGDRSLSELAPLEAEVDDDLRVLLRPLGQGDLERVRRAWALLSEESRMNRFWEKPREMHPSRAVALTDTDPYWHVAWVALDPGDDGFPGFGGASFWRDRDRPDRAELAFTIADAWQRRGLATLLFSVLWIEGWRTGLREFTGTCRLENGGMVSWWRGMGGSAERGSRQWELRLPLEPPEAMVQRVGYEISPGMRRVELREWMQRWLEMAGAGER